MQTRLKGIRCTHGRLRLRFIYLRSGDIATVARYCGKPAVTVIEGCPACAKHARNPKAA